MQILLPCELRNNPNPIEVRTRQNHHASYQRTRVYLPPPHLLNLPDLDDSKSEGRVQNLQERGEGCRRSQYYISPNCFPPAGGGGGWGYRSSLMNDLDSSISLNAFMLLFIYLLKFIYLLFDWKPFLFFLIKGQVDVGVRLSIPSLSLSLSSPPTFPP